MLSLDLQRFPSISLPRFVKVRQHFESNKIKDIPLEISKKMQPHMTNLSGKRIAVAVGSRGITRLAEITKSVIDQLKEAGAIPFIIPAMGSHGGASAEGQVQLLSSFGITMETMGVPIDGSMDVEGIGQLDVDLPIYVCKSAIQADGVVAIARVKPHTCFRGEIESGVCKMLAIGLGKQIGASSLHSHGFKRFAEIIPKAATLIANKIPTLLGIALVENAYEETAVIEVLSRTDIIMLEKEKQLLRQAKEMMGKILFPIFDVLIIDEIGKNISGDGQDPNVTGLFFTRYASGGPEYKKCAILDVTEASHGNANGVGMADVTTRKLFDKIDFISMYTNAFTSTEVQAVKIPMVASTTEDAIRMVVKMCNGVSPYEHKIVWIKNTLELGELWISEPLAAPAEAHPFVSIVSKPCEIKFVQGEPTFVGSE